MSITTGTFPGVRIVDMPDLGAVSDTTSVVAEKAGSGRINALALRDYSIQTVPALIDSMVPPLVASLVPPMLPFVMITTYGGVGDGVTANDAALGSAFAALGANGGTVMFPPGTFNFAAVHGLPNNVTLLGAGKSATTLSFSCDGNPCLGLGVGSQIRSMQISASVPQTGVMILLQGNASAIDDFTLVNYFKGINMVGLSLSNLIIGASISRGNMFQPIANASGYGILVDNFGGCFIDRVNMSGPASGTQPGASFAFRNGDTLLMSNCNATKHGWLDCQTDAGTNLWALTISDCLFDNATDRVAAAAFTGAGNVRDTVITGTWFGYSGGHGLLLSPTGAGTVSGMEVIGCQFVLNAAGSGVRISGTAGGVTGVNITGGRAEGNAQSGAHVDGTTISGISFNGFRAGGYASRPGNGSTGITTSGALDRYVITNCSLYGNVGASLTDGASGVNKVVANNLLT
jgi:hypothetical protein